MKKIIIAFVTLLLAFGLFTLQSCKKDETPAPVVKYMATIPVATLPVVSSAGTVIFTGSTIDLAWAADNKGKPASWDLYYGTSKSPALLIGGLTATTKTVDVQDGITYYWRVISTDDAGIKTTSPLFSFTAINGSNPKFPVTLTTTTDVATVIGVDLPADDVVDLRFLIINNKTGNVDTIVDAAKANEVFRGFIDFPDGEYLLAVDIYSTTNFGDLNAPVNLSLALNFAQKGIMDTTYFYPNVMTNAFACEIHRTNLATVTKIGSQYTIARTVSYYIDRALADPIDAQLIGTWSGYDADPGYPSEVVSAFNAGKLGFTGIGRGWMQDAWGEVITKEYSISMNLNYCGETLEIPYQKICETTWKGDAQPPYYIQGSGTYNMTGAYPSMRIRYDFIQPEGAGGIASYLGLPYFSLVISLDPGKKAPINSGTKVSGFPINPRR